MKSSKSFAGKGRKNSAGPSRQQPLPSKRALRKTSDANLKKSSNETETSDDEDDDDEDIPDQDDLVDSEEDEFADIPRVAQWIDEDEIDALNEEEEEEEIDEDDEEAQERVLKKDLSSLPFGALAKAETQLTGQLDSDSDGSDSDSSTSDDDDDQGPKASTSKATQQDYSDPKPRRKTFDKRTNKHAPTEVTSKRPVSRLRTIVDVPKIERRDPRFSSLSGEFSPETFSKSYSFLNTLQKSEAETLKASLRTASKLLRSSPAALREEREEEVRRLQRALKRAESNVERAKREERTRVALGQVKKAELEKREQGKQGWYLKDSEKREILAKARYDELAKEGRGALKKAVEKRKLKVSQKEKKARPYGKGTGGGGGLGKTFGERRGDGPDGKRRRVA